MARRTLNTWQRSGERSELDGLDLAGSVYHATSATWKRIQARVRSTIRYPRYYKRDLNW